MFVIDSIARPLVLLDANAVRYCFKRDGFTTAELERLRNTMRKLAKLNLVRFVFTQPVDWELTQVYFEEGSQAYKDLFEFYVDISSEWVLKNEHERRELELRLGRKLKLSEVFDSRLDVPTTLRLRQDAAVIQELHDAQRKYKNDEAAEEEAKRTGLIPELDAHLPNWRTSFSKEASEAWTKIIRHYAKTEMRKVARRLGMRIAPRSWPPPSNLATFWYGESFYIAKFLSVFVDTEKQLTSRKSLKSMPDMMDATHFRDSAYADVLVTQDQSFRTVAQRASTGLKVMTFDDFARLVLSHAPALGV